MKTIQLIFLAAVLLSSAILNAQVSTTKSTVTTTVKSAAATKPTTVSKVTTTTQTSSTAKKAPVKKKVTKSTTISTVNTSKLSSAAAKTSTTVPAKTATKTVVSPDQMAAKVVPATSTSVTPQSNKADGSTANPTPGTTNTGKGGKMGTDNGSSTTTTTTNTTTGGTIIDKLTGGTTTNITQLDAASAIKEALSKGIMTGVGKVSATDGYFGNSLIKIPFPQDVQIVESTLRSFGMGSMIDNLVLSLNRAAENAAVQAGPIFLNSIKQMNINDALNIVGNQQPDAATQFLQRTTTESLVGAFKPSIKTALDNTLATKYWTDITSYYNKIPFVSPVNSDLPDYVTRKATSGLFMMIAQEEAKIRKDPVGTGSAIVDKVFGAFKK